jgi:cupin 2 domain-containing protein
MPVARAENLFDGIAADLPAELSATLHRAEGLRIERIVSQGHASPPGFWYDQAEHEWVLVLQGAAELQFAGDATPVKLAAGSYLFIPAHAKHRVSATSATEKTVWLAIHYRPGKTDRPAGPA